MGSLLKEAELGWVGLGLLAGSIGGGVNVFAFCSGLGWDLRRMVHQFSRGQGCVL